VSLVVDASFVVAALVDAGPDGTWAEGLLHGHSLVAPQLMRVEATNVLRRAAQLGDLSWDVAALSMNDLLELDIRLVPFEPVALRVWELRGSVTAYDGWYVALAEALDVPLATLDRRLARAAGPRCAFETPPPQGR
jgi:predicted nucleic acid-binding protein